MTSQRINLLAIGLALIALIAGALGVYQVNALKQTVATLQAANQNLTLAAKRIGAAPIGPEHSLDVPNVARDPAEVPPPLTRTAPTTVAFTLTFKELTAELADGTSYDFWTFDGTVPGP